MVSGLLLGRSCGLTHQCNVQCCMQEIHRLFTAEIQPGQTLYSTRFLKPPVTCYKIDGEQVQFVNLERFACTVKAWDLVKIQTP